MVISFFLIFDDFNNVTYLKKVEFVNQVNHTSWVTDVTPPDRVLSLLALLWRRCVILALRQDGSARSLPSTLLLEIQCSFKGRVRTFLVL